MRHLKKLSQAHGASKAVWTSVGPYWSPCLWMRDGQTVEAIGLLLLQLLQADKPGSESLPHPLLL